MKDKDYLNKLKSESGSKQVLKFSFMLTQTEYYLKRRLQLFRSLGIKEVNVRKSRFGSGYTIESDWDSKSKCQTCSPDYESVMKIITKNENIPWRQNASL